MRVGDNQTITIVHFMAINLVAGLKDEIAINRCQLDGNIKEQLVQP